MHLLLILDGYGLADDPSVSAIAAARTPFLDRLFAQYPHSTLEASGLAVGLPVGLMGNSEVGHTNLGAGRVVYQDLTRIDRDIATGDFFRNGALLAACRHARSRERRLHLMGLVSDGGVHSHIAHAEALLELAAREGLRGAQTLVHAFTDGRDTDPHGGADYVRRLEASAARIGAGRVASVVGRYWAMDRDRRWERTERAYRLLVHGEGTPFDDPAAYLEASYANGVTDEFVEPGVLAEGHTRLEDGDAVVFFNFRADRARQLTQALTDPAFEGFARGHVPALHLVAFTPYGDAFEGVPVAFPKTDLTETLGEVVSRAGRTQLRAAETEKYPHVTFFFNGGREVQFEGERRILVPSPKVPTYDLQPEMSAPELAARVAAALRAPDRPDLAVVNIANPDMVGHTGVFEAAVRAVEATDRAAEAIVSAALEAGYTVQIIADHGNADRMRNPDGSPHTAHTTALVPHLVIAPGVEAVRPGILGDVAPTVLRLMGLPQPAAMTGTPLVGDVPAPEPAPPAIAPVSAA